MDYEPKVEISTEKLIGAVKKRAALYSKTNLNYHNHGKYKGGLWKEVCREVFPEWGNISPRRKLEYAHDLQRRWKNIRTCFTRELSLQKKEMRGRENSTSDSDFKKRRKYIHFDKLTFLINADEIPEAPDIKEPVDEDSNDPLESQMFNMESEDSDRRSAYEESSSNHHYVQIEEEPFQANMFQRDGNMKQELLQMVGDMKKSETEDEDRQFALSIVPALRKLNDQQKFDAKIEILKVLKRISSSSDS
ncbi:uncharacterized protein LOC135078541 [Ostrinia nubilalis]|uniref:uncharacterized protein LOC135078541 n=1 Tax=Ostrinia nubilalis TaxID=29057 RepID=UPI0030824860